MTFASDHFIIEEPAAGVFALLAGTTGACVSNAAVVDLGDKTVVFDTFMTLLAGDDLLAAVRALTGRDAFLTVNSHWHDDHMGSNQLFTNGPIVSTRRTAELIAGNVTTDPAVYAAEVDTYLGDIREREKIAPTDDLRARARMARLGAEALVAGKDRFRLALPDVFIDARMVVQGADREIEILTYGGGHTESDVFAHLPAEGIVVGGDLIWVDAHPRTNDGDPANWAAILDRMAALGPQVLIPGHGPLGSVDHIGALAGYLRHVDQVVAESAGFEPDRVAALPLPPGSEDWAGTSRFNEGVIALLGN